MNAVYNRVKTNWAELWNDKKFLTLYVVNLVACYAIYMALVKFLIYNRLRPGVVLCDPIMSFFPPRDFTMPIFFFTYASIVSFTAYIFLAYPRDVYYVARAFLAVFVLRVCFIYLVPLSPPEGMIYLRDPFLDSLVFDGNNIINDLFFSGHLSDICIFIFCCKYKPLKYFLIASGIAVGLMLVWQHVHYTADVVASPFFAYVCYAVFAKKQIE